MLNLYDVLTNKYDLQSSKVNKVKKGSAVERSRACFCYAFFDSQSSGNWALGTANPNDDDKNTPVSFDDFEAGRSFKIQLLD